MQVWLFPLHAARKGHYALVAQVVGLAKVEGGAVHALQQLPLARKGRGLNEQFTVRRISYGEGVERIFPLHSPRIEKVEVETKGNPRRAKLFYLRGRSDMAVREVVEARKKK